MTKFIVKTQEGYLCPSEDGDVTVTPDEAEAGHFSTTSEAVETAELFGFGFSEIEVIAADPAPRRVIRQ